MASLKFTLYHSAIQDYQYRANSLESDHRMYGSRKFLKGTRLNLNFKSTEFLKLKSGPRIKGPSKTKVKLKTSATYKKAVIHTTQSDFSLHSLDCTA